MVSKDENDRPQSRDSDETSVRDLEVDARAEGEGEAVRGGSDRSPAPPVVVNRLAANHCERALPQVLPDFAG